MSVGQSEIERLVEENTVQGRIDTVGESYSTFDLAVIPYTKAVIESLIRRIREDRCLQLSETELNTIGMYINKSFSNMNNKNCGDGIWRGC